MANETAESKLLKIIEATKKEEGSFVSASSQKKGLSFQVQHLNAILILAVLASVAYMGYEIKMGMDLLASNIDITVNKKVETFGKDVLSNPKNVEYYLSRFENRNVFTPFEEEVVENANADVQTLETKMNKYALVGVAWLDVPESASVMIENKENGETHFLQEGDKIDDVTLKIIYIDRAVFGYENEEIVIKL